MAGTVALSGESHVLRAIRSGRVDAQASIRGSRRSSCPPTSTRVHHADDDRVDRQLLGLGREPGAGALADQHHLVRARRRACRPRRTSGRWHQPVARPSRRRGSGSTISSLCPVIDATFWVATTLPVTRARNIGRQPPSVPSSSEARVGLPGDDDLLVGRHDPDLHARAGRSRRASRPGPLRCVAGSSSMPNQSEVAADARADARPSSRRCRR